MKSVDAIGRIAENTGLSDDRTAMLKDCAIQSYPLHHNQLKQIFETPQSSSSKPAH